jgi:multiple sugar transport system substrate-binding protein
MTLIKNPRMNKIPKSVKFLAFIGLVILYISLFPFLSRENKKETDIYFAERISAAHQLIIEKFNKRYEGKIKVIPIDFPSLTFSTNERKELLARSLRGLGDGIDLLAVDVIWVQRFAKWCEPLGKYYSEEEKRNFVEPLLKSCYYEGELVALPFEFDIGVLYFREDLLKGLKDYNEILKKLGSNISWEDFIKIKQSVNTKNPLYIYPADNYEGLICCFIELLLSLDKDYFKKYSFNLNTPEAQKSLQLLVDLVQKYNLTPRIVTDFTEIPSYKYFIENDALFIRGWSTYDKDFINTSLQSEKAKFLKKATIPHFKNSGPTTVIGGWNLMMPKFSNKKNEVLTFINFLLNEESQEILYKEAGFFPVIKKFYEDSTYLKKYPEFEQYREMISYSVSRPMHEDYTRYSDIMSFYFKQAILGQITVKEALEKATYAIQSKQVMLEN